MRKGVRKHVSRKKARSHLISKRISEIPYSFFSKFIGLKGKGIISLGPGEPDFSTPKHIIDAAHSAIEDGYTHYAPMRGYPDLLEAISKKAYRQNKIKIDDPQTQICVTAGSTESLLLSMFAAFDESQAVLTPDPGFVTYGPCAKLIGMKPVPYNLSEKTGFQLDLDDLNKKITAKTKGIIINSPSNPTGTVFNRNLLEELADIAVENDLTIISDEAYEYCVFNGNKHISMASLNGMADYVLSNFTVSKAYAMAGWRLGYVVANPKVIEKIVSAHIYTSVSASSISQRAALAAFTGPQKCVSDMAREYDRRRRFVVKRIQEIKGFELEVVPEGAFYIFPKIVKDEVRGVYPHSKIRSDEFSLWLFNKAKIITMPGSEFGKNGEGFLRMSYATDYSLIGQAMDRLERLFGSR